MCEKGVGWWGDEMRGRWMGKGVVGVMVKGELEKVEGMGKFMEKMLEKG